ncbi:hypothetical protein [Pedococcus soli]
MPQVLREPVVVGSAIAMVGTILGVLASTLLQNRSAIRTLVNTSANLDRQLAADHERRLWEARRDVYGRFIAVALAHHARSETTLGDNLAAKEGWPTSADSTAADSTVGMASLEQQYASLRWQATLLASPNVREHIGSLARALTREDVAGILDQDADPGIVQLALVGTQNAMRQELGVHG